MSEEGGEFEGEHDMVNFEQEVYKAFMAFDYEGNGTISNMDIPKVLESLQESISQNDCFRLIA